MKNLSKIVWWRNKDEGNTFRRKVKSFEAITEEKARNMSPILLDMLYRMSGKSIFGKVWYLKAFSETEQRLKFVPQNHPLRVLPLN